ncbi:hypothetical protein A3K69_07960 [Candidatus Bathyarchaeota archaeon RBG_16_57_9]|nr:MAG: hypothetical protein A3K69_07960 [Candidatus Bathyarchaeota archaeon RBG_16_57_9]
MRYCPKCGKENSDTAEFCRHCGERMAGVTYVKPRGSEWNAGRVIVTIIGALMVFTAFGLIMGGGSLRALSGTIMDEDGYIVSGLERLSTDSYAMVVQDLDVHIDYEASRVLRAMGGDIVFKLEARSRDPSKPVFLGVAQDQYASTYLGQVEYDRLVSGRWEYDPFVNDFPDYTLSRHPGQAPSGPPTMHSFWAAHQAGTGNQVLTWSPTTGSYWVVVMNEDASAVVDADVRLGVRVPLIGSLGSILLASGIVMGLIGAVILYFTVVRR